LKKTFVAIFISFILAVVSANGESFFRKRIIPIVFTLEKLPRYWRKKALKIRTLESKT